jgi:hypothetical protein
MVNNEFEKKLDKSLEELINSEISAPQHLVIKVNRNILQHKNGKKGKNILASFIPAGVIILANTILVLVLMFSKLHFTTSIFESLLVIYFGVSALSLLGVFSIAVLELRTEY